MYSVLVPASGAPDRTLLLIGIVLQVLLIVARRLAPSLLKPVVALVADGITVLLFGLATFRAIWSVLAEL